MGKLSKRYVLSVVAPLKKGSLFFSKINILECRIKVKLLKKLLSCGGGTSPPKKRLEKKNTPKKNAAIMTSAKKGWGVTKKLFFHHTHCGQINQWRDTTHGPSQDEEFDSNRSEKKLTSLNGKPTILDGIYQERMGIFYGDLFL